MIADTGTSATRWKLLRRMGWRLQRPARRAAERDEQVIAGWVAEDWPWDLPQRPPPGVDRVLGRDAHNTDALIGALGHLRVFLGGQKATLVWNGLPARRGRAMGHRLAYSFLRCCGSSLW